jgi:putative intracellular protease/amidase
LKVQVVCAQRYNGHELWTALGVIRTRGIQFQLASTKLIIEDEVTHRKNRIRQVVEDDLCRSVETCDGLMIVSGNMKDTENYWTDRRVLKTVDAFDDADKPIAAICCSVPTIRSAASGKRVSFFPLIRSRVLLQDAGAILQTVAMTRDKNLVTAEHQMATEVWAEEFCNLLRGLPQEHYFHDSGFVPRGRERRPIPELERLKELRKR